MDSYMTQNFYLRIPLDLYQKFERQVPHGKRTQFLLTILASALRNPSNAIRDNPDPKVQVPGH